MTSFNPRHQALASVVLAIALVGLSAGSALAANARYATPGGSGAQPCEESAPCALAKALTGSGVNGVADGDHVILLPGTYHPTEALIVTHSIEISGEPGAAVPLIEGAGNYGLEAQGTSFVHDLRVHQETGVSAFFMLNGAGRAERVFASGGSAASNACAFFGTTVRDTVCWSEGSNGAGIQVSAGGFQTIVDTLHNVTAVGATGIEPEAGFEARIVIDGVNVIASGSSHDVEAHTDLEPGTAATVNLTNSNFSTTKADGPTISISAPGSPTNQTAKPLFANALGGDFREVAGSPTIGAGDVSVVQPGELDLGLAPRTGADSCGHPRVDIGAYQSAIVPTCPPPPPPGPGAKKKTAPKLSSFKLNPSHFGAAGATLRFKLSARAKVTIGVWRARPKHKLGLLHVSGHPGKNKVHFSGRVAGHPLAPGKYLLRAYATSSGKRSRTVTRPFQITG